LFFKTSKIKKTSKYLLPGGLRYFEVFWYYSFTENTKNLSHNTEPPTNMKIEINTKLQHRESEIISAGCRRNNRHTAAASSHWQHG